MTASRTSSEWQWLVGRKLSLGEVTDILGETATVRRGDDEVRVLVCELLHEDYQAQDRHAATLCEAFNTGAGAYRP